MITFGDAKLVRTGDEGNVYLKQGSCLSTDTKPTDVANGSILVEMDTGTVYTFDEANSTWRAFTV